MWTRNRSALQLASTIASARPGILDFAERDFRHVTRTVTKRLDKRCLLISRNLDLAGGDLTSGGNTGRGPCRVRASHGKRRRYPASDLAAQQPRYAPASIPSLSQGRAPVTSHAHPDSDRAACAVQYRMRNLEQGSRQQSGRRCCRRPR